MGSMKASLLKHGMNLWPPFWGAGIHVDHISNDYRSAKVSLKLRLLNRNIVGVHFGGSLFAMTDPFFMLLFSQNLGKEYIVWDRAAKIEFLKPGRTNVYAQFHITQQQIDEVRNEANEGEKILKDYSVDVLSTSGDVIARVTKTLYIRKKQA
jgi:acyl-coenzyme A thioesterase PaaI-like protein